jgi:Cu-Zn family superoxide dismutase
MESGNLIPVRAGRAVREHGQAPGSDRRVNRDLLLCCAVVLLLAVADTGTAVLAADVQITMNRLTTEGVGEPVGTVVFRDSSDFGLLIIPRLEGLSPGAHGFHVHQNPSCEPAKKDGKPVAGLAAGGHYDPEDTGRHEGPVGKGHLGDLPVLLVAADGTTPMAMFAPRLQVTDLIGRAVIVHAGGDNYSDEPKALGGGGARVACGVIGVDAME